MGKSAKGKKAKKQPLPTLKAKASRNDAEIALPPVPTVPAAPKVVVEQVEVVERQRPSRAPIAVEIPKLETPTPVTSTNEGYVVHTRYDEDNKPVFSKIQVSKDTILLQYHRNNPNSVVFPLGTKVSFDVYLFKGKDACNNVKAIGTSSIVEDLQKELKNKAKMETISFGELLSLVVFQNKSVKEITKNIKGVHGDFYYV